MSEPVYFTRLEIEKFRCFGPKTTLDLSDGKGNWKKWTVILGDNGTGKTTLLQILAALQIEESSFRGTETFSYAPIGFLHFDNDPPGFDVLKLRHGKAVGHISGFAESDKELISLLFYGPHQPAVSTHQNEKLLELKCFGYGANRKMGKSSLTKTVYSNSETLFFDDKQLINVEEWLLHLDYASRKDSDIKDFFAQKRDQLINILIDLLPDIKDIRFTEPTKNDPQSTVEFNSPYGWVTIHQLSLGYKTMVAWMADLAANIFDRYPDSDNPLAEPAIVLVDEIDLHLHPKWQRKIFDYLSEKFPQTQFIVTAHSPLVVQSAPKDANIVLLRKEGDHVVIDNDIKSVQNWRLDQILTSDLFGIESARGPEAEQWLQERTELLQKQSLTPTEKERLKELNQRAHNLPTADNQQDIEAMELIRKAADYLKNQKA